MNAVLPQPKTVLFVCDLNACRSQMAAAVFNRLANSEIVRAVSAGTRPARRVHPLLRAAMLEIGIDPGAPRPRLVSPNAVAGVQVLITLDCADSCPSPQALPRDDWSLTDPADASIEPLRAVRDEIVSRVRNLVAARPWA
jgi:arsenate reductase (thioredoxin)